MPSHWGLGFKIRIWMGHKHSVYSIICIAKSNGCVFIRIGCSLLLELFSLGLYYFTRSGFSLSSLASPSLFPSLPSSVVVFLRTWSRSLPLLSSPLPFPSLPSPPLLSSPLPFPPLPSPLLFCLLLSPALPSVDPLTFQNLEYLLSVDS